MVNWLGFLEGAGISADRKLWKVFGERVVGFVVGFDAGLEEVLWNLLCQLNGLKCVNFGIKRRSVSTPVSTRRPISFKETGSCVSGATTASAASCGDVRF
jgi:hypothetical protein